MKKKILKFENLFLEVKNKNKNSFHSYKRLISNISGEFVSGRLVALMGGSGSGKSSLINLLTGKIDESARTSGTIVYNGKNRTSYNWLKNLAHLEQNDKYIPFLTVKETIENSIKLKGRRYTSRLSKKIVDNIMKELNIKGLSGSLLSCTSGGEIKRCLIASEVITDKDILFLDEPTTGLDSHLALELIMILKNYAVTRNKIVVISVHQPGDAMFSLFDDLIFLHKGYSFYNGKAEDLNEFLLEHNLIKPNHFSMSEFLFELHSSKPVLIKPGSYEGAINEIHNRNILEAEEIFENENMEKSQEQDVDVTFSLDHISILLKRQFLCDFRSGLFLKVFISKLILILVIFFLIYKKIERDSVAVIKKYGYNLTNLGFINDLKCMLPEEYLDIYNPCINVLGLVVTSFFIPLSIFNDSGFLNYIDIFEKESYEATYTQVSLYIAMLIYECSLSLFRTVLIVFLLKLTQLRVFLTPYFIVSLMALSMSIVIFFLMIKSLSSNAYITNIFRIGVFCMVTMYRPPILSASLNNLLSNYKFMVFLRPLTYFLVFFPFAFIDSLYFTKIIKNQHEERFIVPIIKLINWVASLNIDTSDGVPKNILNRHLNFFNGHYFSTEALYLMSFFSFFLVIILSVVFLIMRFSPTPRLILSKRSSGRVLKKILIK